MGSMIVTGVAAVILGCHQGWGENSEIGGPSPPYFVAISNQRGYGGIISLLTGSFMPSNL